jgi:hypothetical protein
MGFLYNNEVRSRGSFAGCYGRIPPRQYLAVPALDGRLGADKGGVCHLSLNLPPEAVEQLQDELGKLRAMYSELEGEVRNRPRSVAEFIINPVSHKVHKPACAQYSQLPPVTWKSVCGWRFGLSPFPFGRTASPRASVFAMHPGAGESRLLPGVKWCCMRMGRGCLYGMRPPALFRTAAYTVASAVLFDSPQHHTPQQLRCENNPEGGEGVVLLQIWNQTGTVGVRFVYSTLGG